MFEDYSRRNRNAFNSPHHFRVERVDAAFPTSATSSGGWGTITFPQKKTQLEVADVEKASFIFSVDVFNRIK